MGGRGEGGWVVKAGREWGSRGGVQLIYAVSVKMVAV